MGLGRKGRAIDAGLHIYFLFSYFFSKHEWHLCKVFFSGICHLELNL